MWKSLVAIAVCASGLAILSVAHAAAPSGDGGETVCKYVTTPERGKKPFEMCLTKAQWAAKAEADARDPNRIVCRYEDVPGSKLKGRKVCQAASQWDADRAMHREQVELMQKKACIPGAGC